MFEWLTPDSIPAILSGLFMLMLAGLLLAVDFNNTLHRVFSLVLAFQGLVFFIAVARINADLGTHVFLTGLFPYLQFPLLPLYLFFIALYPQPRWFGKWRGTPAVIAGISLLMMAVYVIDHRTYGTIGATPEGFLNTAGRGMAYVEYGPLFLLNSGRRMLSGLLAFIIARDYWKNPYGSAGYSRFLVYAGFAINGLFNGTLGAFDLGYMLSGDAGFPWWPYGWSQWVIPPIGLLLALASLVYIYRASHKESDHPTLQEPRRFLWFVVPLPIISGMIQGIPAIADGLTESMFFVLGIWWLSIPILITYALMRYQVFGADVTIKASIGKIIMAVMFAAIFVTVLEAAEALVGDRLGNEWGILLAVILAVGAAPLQKLANRAAQSVMPDVKPIHEQDPFERGEFYRDQYDIVHDDGVVSTKDRTMLDRLALSLRISKQQQRELEVGTNKLPKIEGYRQQAVGEATSSRRSRFLAALLTAGMFGGISQAIEGLVTADTFAFGLVVGVLAALLTGPLQTLADGLTEAPSVRQARRARCQTYTQAVRDAFVDGNITAKERQYLDKLQHKLALSQVERIRIHLRAARASK